MSAGGSLGNRPSAQLQRALYAVGEALRRNDVAMAMDLSEQALAQGLEDVNFLTLAGQRRLRIGKPETALALLTRGREIGPANIEALNALGLCLAQLGRGRDAVAVFDDALGRSPQTAYLHLHKAQTLEEIGEFRASQAALETLLALDPRDAQALARLAGLAARRGDMAAARGFANRTLAIAPMPAATIALAMADLEDRQFDAARARLAPLLSDRQVSPVNRSIAQGLTGDALDGLDQPAEAFAAYVAARETLRDAAAPLFQGKERGIDRVRRIAAYFRNAPIESWRAVADAAADGPTHVFLVGFPRSGTTLLEQVLASHGEIQTLEEADCLKDTIAEFVDPPGGLEKFAALDAAGLARCRAAYWARAEEFGAKPARPVFIDKMPLNTIHLGLIARLFPAAKILFALRDPRDVVLSCFRRRLVMTAHMYEFTRLESAAAFYAAVMELGQRYRDTLGLALLDTRHEDMLTDFEGELRRVCAFLGLEWDAAMRDFAVQARRRDIKTPSSLQVVRGLSGDGAGQWRRYRAQLEPVLPILARWAARFGYKDS
jgi:tetratricopeptide (TPR) repeat protein